MEACAEAADWASGSEQPVTPPRSPFQSLPVDTTTLRHGRGFACAFKNVGFSFGFPETCDATIELYGKDKIEKVILRPPVPTSVRARTPPSGRWRPQRLAFRLNWLNWTCLTPQPVAIPAPRPRRA
ncbi:MAG: hypothetical protein R3C44_02935 [Chloroflexota bacterium]